MKTKGKFPEKVFTRMDVDDSAPLAYLNQADAIDDDGPTQVAEYRLVGVKMLRKKVAEA